MPGGPERALAPPPPPGPLPGACVQGGVPTFPVSLTDVPPPNEKVSVFFINVPATERLVADSFDRGVAHAGTVTQPRAEAPPAALGVSTAGRGSWGPPEPPSPPGQTAGLGSWRHLRAGAHLAPSRRHLAPRPLPSPWRHLWRAKPPAPVRIRFPLATLGVRAPSLRGLRGPTEGEAVD